MMLRVKILILFTPGSTSPHHPACTVIHSRAVTFLLTKMRDKDLPTKEFQMVPSSWISNLQEPSIKFWFFQLGDRLMRILGEEALARLPTVVPGKVSTVNKSPWWTVLKARLILEQVNSPCGEVLGLVECPGPPVCVVSIVRSGDILQVKSLMPTGGRVQNKQLRCHQTKLQLGIIAVANPTENWSKCIYNQSGGSEMSAARRQCWQDTDSGKPYFLQLSVLNL